ncbi:50S ribosomal protein L32 [Blochmannia endosymbiont of Polyrhachis (Hedomyrma) turneri]|uniref:50S ribosomal protein L32 n=1 Tax=Blochmannia endosymbiont of Polyrhachis (Hedomyrma) turneri TaxID=1505596 RepID=UPI00061A5B50|nr:50S ribosomal protein L32 [Blochmannia endosymbiont of Polyrhachis (Hedomyrma) turneri]AKC59972.1 50S ribosomal protein L32 [Blochmannia endosymbiont of Polyrhachis (Hedomyrma) turneri]
MAVQQNKPTRSKRGMRRSHDSLKLFNMSISIDSCSGELHRRHYITKNGFYRGYEAISIKRVS